MREDPHTRQWQTALVWTSVFVLVAIISLEQGYLLAGLVGLVVLFYAARLLVAVPAPLPSDPTYRPRVSILVAARNEEMVIERLAQNLCNLNYSDYEVWIADDGSTDTTWQKLEACARRLPHLSLLKRPPASRPGKSAVLNDLLQKASGDLLVVFDADAQVKPDFLTRAVAFFGGDPRLGAVQVRKVIVNAEENFWTRGQAAEMILDAFLQQQRVAVGGTAELRGNGQLVRREALRQVGGWTETTVTDDLDLTFKLHLAGWQVQLVFDPFVFEEGVTDWQGLWRQRSRWAEGGFQRYLDYVGPFSTGAMGALKTLDQLIFCFIQYLMPVAALFDLLFALLAGEWPRLSPLLCVATLFTAAGFYLGQRQLGATAEQALGASTLGTLYFLHWFPVIVVKLADMVLRPKRLVWVKTTHQGT